MPLAAEGSGCGTHYAKNCSFRFIERLEVFLSNLRLSPGFLKGGVNQPQSRDPDSHAYDSSDTHGASPSGHGSLRLQIVLLAMLWACFAFSLFRAIRVGEFRNGAFGNYTYACCVGLIGGTIMSLDLCLRLFR